MAHLVTLLVTILGVAGGILIERHIVGRNGSGLQSKGCVVVSS